MFNRKLTFTPLVIEVVGEMDDLTVKQVLDILHSYRNRYSPLFRLLCTLTSVSHSSENEMFARLANKSKTQLHCTGNMLKSTHTPLFAMSIAHLNNDIPVIKRFHTITKDSSTNHSFSSLSMPKSHHSYSELDMYSFYTKRLNSMQASVIDQLETFMSYYFLPLCITHNFMSELSVSACKDNVLHEQNNHQNINDIAEGVVDKDEKQSNRTMRLNSSNCHVGQQSCEEEENLTETKKELTQEKDNCETDKTRLLQLHDIDHFVLRHYVHETTRTCSFLIADTASHQAALIDPQCNIGDYLHDLHKFNLNVALIIYTHCPVDIAIGVGELQEHFPTCTVVVGLAEQSEAGTKATYVLGSTLSLCTTNIPSFAPESLFVELCVKEICVALFTGTALSTDSLPSTSFYYFHEAEQEEHASHTVHQPREPSKQELLTSSAEFEHNTTNTQLFKCQKETTTNSQRVMQIAQHNLKTYLYDTYFCSTHKINIEREGSNNICKKQKEEEEQQQLEACDEEEEEQEQQQSELQRNKSLLEKEWNYNARQQIIIFPGRGGYNNGVTSQLDLYWAVSVRDFTHMSHSQRVVEAMTSFDKYVKFMKQTSNHDKQGKEEREEEELHFPRLLYKFIWQYNKNALKEAFMSSSALPSYNSGNNNTNVKLHVNAEVRNTEISLEVKTNEYSNNKVFTCELCTEHKFCHYTFVIDVRPLPEYEERHIKYSIHTPMNFPATAFNAKKAELWLQNLLLPHCSVLVICSSSINNINSNTTNNATTFCMKEEVAKRFRLIAPSVHLRVCTPEEIDEIMSVNDNSHKEYTEESDNNTSNNNTNSNNGVRKCTVKEFEHWQPLEWVYANAQKQLFSRVTTAEQLLQPNSCNCKYDKNNGYKNDKFQHLEELELYPNSRCCANYTVMVDIRTHAEFKNGSHMNSIHFPLGEMCEEVIHDILSSHEYDSVVDKMCNVEADMESHGNEMNGNTHACFVYVPSIHHAKRFLHNLHTQAKHSNIHVCGNSNELKRIVLYCASGYRTLIAASILQRAFDAASGPIINTDKNQKTYDCGSISDAHDGESLEYVKQIQIRDVKGGALQIMTQRPDLWVLKDRSIICIS